MSPEPLASWGGACLWELVGASCGGGVGGQALGPSLWCRVRAFTSQLCLGRYNSLSILPAALGKPVRDVAAKVCEGQGCMVLGCRASV